VEGIKTNNWRSVTFLRQSCLIWDNVEKYGRPIQATDDNIIRRMRFACWVNKVANTYSEYVILTTFPRKQWLCQSASMWRLQVHCLFCSSWFGCSCVNSHEYHELSQQVDWFDLLFATVFCPHPWCRLMATSDDVVVLASIDSQL